MSYWLKYLRRCRRDRSTPLARRQHQARKLCAMRRQMLAETLEPRMLLTTVVNMNPGPHTLAVTEHVSGNVSAHAAATDNLTAEVVTAQSAASGAVEVPLLDPQTASEKNAIYSRIRPLFDTVRPHAEALARDRQEKTEIKQLWLFYRDQLRTWKTEMGLVPIQDPMALFINELARRTGTVLEVEGYSEKPLADTRAPWGTVKVEGIESPGPQDPVIVTGPHLTLLFTASDDTGVAEFVIRQDDQQLYRGAPLDRLDVTLTQTGLTKISYIIIDASPQRRTTHYVLFVDYRPPPVEPMPGDAYPPVTEDLQLLAGDVGGRLSAAGLDESSRLEEIWRRIEALRFSAEEIAGYKSFFPQDAGASSPGLRALGEIQRELLTLNSRALQAEGFSGTVVWTRNRWERFDLLQGPPGGEPSPVALDVFLMNGERRGEVLMLTNAEGHEQTLTLRLEDLPGGVNPDWITVSHVATLETDRRNRYHDLLLPLEKTSAGYSITVPAGMTVQLWISFEPRSLDPGTHAGRMTVREGSRVIQTSGVSVHVSRMNFPEDLSLSTGMWDYMNSLNQYEISPENHAAIADLMARYEVDHPWATREVLPWGGLGAADFDPAGRFVVPAGYFHAFDNWVGQFPEAERYFVYMNLKSPGSPVTAAHKTFAGANHDTDPALFRTRLQGWLAAVEAHLVNDLGLAPDRLALLLVDEPKEVADQELIVQWGRVMTERDPARGPRIQLFENSSLVDPSETETFGGKTIFDVSDILTFYRYRVLTRQDESRTLDLYRALKEQGKTVHWYSVSELGHDPYVRYLTNGWMAYRYGVDSLDYWSLIDGSGETLNLQDPDAGFHFSPLYFDGPSVYAGKRFEAMFEGRQDHEYLLILERLKAHLQQDLPGERDLIDEIETAIQDAIAAVTDKIPDIQTWLTTPQDPSVADRQRVKLWELIEKTAAVIPSDTRAPWGSVTPVDVSPAEDPGVWESENERVTLRLDYHDDTGVREIAIRVRGEGQTGYVDQYRGAPLRDFTVTLTEGRNDIQYVLVDVSPERKTTLYQLAIQHHPPQEEVDTQAPTGTVKLEGARDTADPKVKWTDQSDSTLHLTAADDVGVAEVLIRVRGHEVYRGVPIDRWDIRLAEGLNDIVYIIVDTSPERKATAYKLFVDYRPQET